MTETTGKLTHVIQSVQNRNLDQSLNAQWHVHYSRFEGDLPGWLLNFNHEALYSRVAEYNFDPEDIDTLLDVIFYEPHMMSFREEHPKFLWNTDIDAAREHHLEEIADLKNDIVYSDPQNFLGKIRDHHDPKHPSLEKHRARVKRIREVMDRTSKGNL